MKTNTAKPTDKTTNGPIHTASCGRVQASVWKNDEHGTTRYKITITRSFNKDGAWTRGRTYFPNELAAVVEVCARVQRWIDWQNREAKLQPTAAGA